jgi:hypothetical protein
MVNLRGIVEYACSRVQYREIFHVFLCSRMTKKVNLRSLQLNILTAAEFQSDEILRMNEYSLDKSLILRDEER